MAFVIGAVFSAVAGNIGMRIATDSNVRTTEAARTSLPSIESFFPRRYSHGIRCSRSSRIRIRYIVYYSSNWFIVGEDSFYNEMTVVLEELGFSPVRNQLHYSPCGWRHLY